MAAGVSDEQMTRYLDFCDYLCSEEGTLFRKYGFEGTDYTLNEDGSVNLLWPKNELGNYTDPYPTGCRGFMGRILLDGGYSDLTNPKYLQEDIDEYAWSQEWDNENATRAIWTTTSSTPPRPTRTSTVCSPRNSRPRPSRW